MLGLVISIVSTVTVALALDRRDKRRNRKHEALEEDRFVLAGHDPLPIAERAIDRATRPLTDERREELKTEIRSHWNRHGHHIIAGGDIDALKNRAHLAHGQTAIHNDPSLALDPMLDIILDHMQRCPPSQHDDCVKPD